MRVAFVYSEMEYIGIESLAAALQARGHQTTLLFDPLLFADTVTQNDLLSRICDYSDQMIADAKAFDPQLLAFSVLTTNYAWARDLAIKFKKSLNVPVVFGGIHVTSLPFEMAREGIADYLVVGEGEEALLDLVECLERREVPLQVKNVWFKHEGRLVQNEMRPLRQDLDALPFPDKDLFYRHMPYLSDGYTIMTGRGCPHSCSYCCNSYLNRLYKGTCLRRRSVGNVMQELLEAHEKFHFKSVFFDDSTFTYDRKWLVAMAESYRMKIGVPFFCWVHPNDVDEELVVLLYNMGCRAVEMGVESLIPSVRKDLFNRHYDNDTIAHAINLFNKYGIFCVVDNILGFGQDPETEMRDMVAFYNQHRPQKVYIFEYRPFPRTKLAEDLKFSDTDLSAGVRPFTISTKASGRYVRRLQLLMSGIYFLSPHAVDVILRQRWYRFLPPVAAYNILELLPYLMNLFRTKEKRLWYPVRGTRRRYMHYLMKSPGYFMKRIFCHGNTHSLC